MKETAEMRWLEIKRYYDMVLVGNKAEFVDKEYIGRPAARNTFFKVNINDIFESTLQS